MITLDVELGEMCWEQAYTVRALNCPANAIIKYFVATVPNGVDPENVLFGGKPFVSGEGVNGPAITTVEFPRTIGTYSIYAVCCEPIP